MDFVLKPKKRTPEPKPKKETPPLIKSPKMTADTKTQTGGKRSEKKRSEKKRSEKKRSQNKRGKSQKNRQ
jgi:hypothetical protein